MRTNTTVAFLFGFVLLTVAVLGLYYTFRFGVGLFADLGPEVAAVTAVASITVFLSALIVAGGLRAAGRGAEAGPQHAARAAVYERFLREHAHASGAAAQPEIRHRLAPDDAHAIDRQMLLHASPEVLKTYLRLRRTADHAEPSADAVEREVGRLVLAMRKDLGHRSLNVRERDISDLLARQARPHSQRLS